MFNVVSSRLTNELFERALGDSLKDFSRIPWLKEEQKRCLRSTADKKDVFGILPTGFGKSLVFQLLQTLVSARAMNDQNVICFQARLMSTLTLFMVVRRVGVLPSGQKH